MILGITGGIGCGKSTVLELLKEHYQAELVEMDKVGHIVMSPGYECYRQIVKAFGTDILLADGTIDRGKLSEVVFKDKNKLELLNGFVHPAVRTYAIQKVIEYRNKTGLLVLESAILFEADYGHVCDMTWYIYADNEIRIQRLIKNRGYSRAKIQGVIKNQMPSEKLQQLTDYTIDNSKDIAYTLQQIKAILTP